MDACKNVLLVTNATTDAEIAEIKKIIVQSAEPHLKIKLSLVHIIPTLPTCYFNMPSMMLLAERYYEDAKKSLACIGELLNIHQDHQWLITGKARAEVLRLANKLNTHFILASHTTLPELRKPFLFNLRTKNPTPIRAINHISLPEAN
ncbi:MAG: hypothetical protein K0R24_1033 [Gammaproteobacteria bacterium]|jgi:hypothetical protein|nr:hypothetical protein [Gammaproteobacteria bacterium]